MAVANTVLGVNKFNNGIELFVKHTISGNYATPGESVDYALLNTITNRQPDYVQVMCASGYKMVYDLANKRLKTHLYDYNNAADGPTIEIPDAAYPAPVSADTQIVARAVWFRR